MQAAGCCRAPAGDEWALKWSNAAAPPPRIAAAAPTQRRRQVAAAPQRSCRSLLCSAPPCQPAQVSCGALLPRPRVAAARRDLQPPRPSATPARSPVVPTPPGAALGAVQGSAPPGRAAPLARRCRADGAGAPPGACRPKQARFASSRLSTSTPWGVSAGPACAGQRGAAPAAAGTDPRCRRPPAWLCSCGAGPRPRPSHLTPTVGPPGTLLRSQDQERLHRADHGCTAVGGRRWGLPQPASRPLPGGN